MPTDARYVLRVRLSPCSRLPLAGVLPGDALQAEVGQFLVSDRHSQGAFSQPRAFPASYPAARRRRRPCRALSRPAAVPPAAGAHPRCCAVHRAAGVQPPAPPDEEALHEEAADSASKPLLPRRWIRSGHAAACAWRACRFRLLRHGSPASASAAAASRRRSDCVCLCCPCSTMICRALRVLQPQSMGTAAAAAPLGVASRPHELLQNHRVVACGLLRDTIEEAQSQGAPCGTSSLTRCG